MTTSVVARSFSKKIGEAANASKNPSHDFSGLSIQMDQAVLNS
jgi:hypothetical protein